MRLFYIFAAVVFFCLSTKADPLVNARIRYDYISSWGADSNAYTITLDVFTNCLEYYSTVDIAIYENKSGGKLSQKATLPLTSLTWADPFISPNISAPYCVLKNTYIDTVYLPINTGGYILYFVDNFRYTTYSNAFSVLIPSAGVQNTVPINNLPPSFTIKTGETITVDVALQDAEGDSLVYTLSDAYHSTMVFGNPYPPILDSSKLFLSYYKPVIWSDVLGGKITLDPVSGQLEMIATNPKSATMGIIITEYRAGVVINRYTSLLNVTSIIREDPGSPHIELYGEKNAKDISLSWTFNLSLVDEFIIERKVDNGPWTTISNTGKAQYGNDKTQFADNAVRHYRVKTVGYIGLQKYYVASNQWITGGDVSTGMTASITNPGITVYPNPATDNLLIKLNDNVGYTQLQITDVMGRQVYLQNIDVLENSAQINIQALQSGIYVLILHSSDGQTAVQKFYKK